MKKLIAVVAGLAGLMFLATAVLAVPGDPVPPGSITPPGPAGVGCGGIGVAFDGTNIWYTCADEDKIRKTNLLGADLGSIDTAEGATSVSVDAIAWDPNEGKIWGGELVNTDGVPGNDTCRIYSIDPVNGAATTRFSFVDTHGGCDFSYYDGLTIDTLTDTLWLSPDVHSFIHHYQKNGTEIAGDLIDFAALTPAGEPDLNSGLAIGIDGTLFGGTNGFGKIVQINTPGPGATFAGVFTTVSGRDEDLECGPVVEGKETILSRDFFFPGRIDILEVPEGTCVSPVAAEITLDPPTDTNEAGSKHTVTATVSEGGQPIVGTLVSFSITAGPNAGEVSDPSECTVDPNCNTDAAGMTSWTYTGAAAVGIDTVEACFLDQEGQRRCAEATKDWVDTTPPKVACTETVNPHGKTVPPAGKTTLPGPRGGQNEDGFYELLARDLIAGLVQIFVTDAGGAGPFGPFASGDRVKITEAPGAIPSSQPMGSSNGQAGAILTHIILNGDAIITATDPSGNVARETCLVPPPPK